MIKDFQTYTFTGDAEETNLPTFKQDKDYFSYVNAHNKATLSDPRLVEGYIYADSEQGPIKMAKYDPNYVPESINKIIIINDLSH